MDKTVTNETCTEFWTTVLQDDDFETYPKFITLLNRLKENISPEGTSCKLEKQLKEANALLKTAKSNYLKVATIYDIINELKYQDGQKSESASVLHRKINQILVEKEVEQKLACLQVKEIGTAKSEHGLLGIDFCNRTKTTLSDGDLKSLQNMVHIQLEAYCREMTQLYSRMTDTGKGDKPQFSNGKLSTELCQLFSAIIENKKQELEENKEKLEATKRLQQRLILKFYQTLNNAVHSMTDIGEICKSNNYSSKEAELMILSAEVLLLKIRSLRLRLMTEIYDEKSVKAHSKIKECLEYATAKLQSEKVLTEHRIAVYDSVGSQFHHLLNEYVEVMTKINTFNMLSKEVQGDKE